MARRKMMAPTLTVEEESALIREWQNTKNDRAMRRLLDAFRPFLKQIVLGWHHRSKLSFDDLMSQAQIGFIEGVNRFDFKKDCRLSTYVRWWIYAELGRFVTYNSSILSFHDHSTARLLWFNLGKYKHRLGVYVLTKEHPATAMIAKEVGCRIELVLDIQRFLQKTVSIDTAPAGIEDDHPFFEIPDMNAVSEDDIATADDHREKLELINEAVDAVLHPREKEIFLRRVRDDGVSLDDLGKVFNISRERVRQIQMQATQKIREFVGA